MSKQPVIFLAFANSSTSPLLRLSQEDDALFRLLHPRATKEGHFLLHRESHASLENLRKYFTAYKNQIIIFHYAGHANGAQLFLKEGKAEGEGLAEMLAEQQNLQLVFLNGCSTEGQVNHLLELGIPSVIATSAPIEDELAATFAKHFYDALIQDNSLEEAYKQASNFLKAKGSGEEQISTRGFVFKKQAEKLPFKWGIFTQNNQQASLKYKLPATNTQQIIIRGASERFNTVDIPVNELLTQTLFDTLANHSDELEFMQFQAAKGKTPDIRRVRLAIMNALPAPLAEHIRKLFAADPSSAGKDFDRIGLKRLEQLERTAGTLMELLTLTLISQLWDEKVKNTKLELGNGLANSLKVYFQQDDSTIRFYDYLPLIQKMYEAFSDQNIQHFMEELGDWDAEETTFQQANTFMQALKAELYTPNHQVAAAELESICVQAEQHLCELLKPFGFLARYKMMTVKNIELNKYRHQQPVYRHVQVALDTVTAGYLDTEADYEGFADSRSVLWLKSSENIKDYLCLSPFVIDWHAWKGEKQSKLFFIDHYAANMLHYKYVNIQLDKLPMSDRQTVGYRELQRQFLSFLETLELNL